MRAFVNDLHFLDHLNSAHAADDAAENHVLVVHKGKRGARGDVELSVVGVLEAVSLAHAEQTDFRVLNVERLVCEFTAEDGCLFD